MDPSNEKTAYLEGQTGFYKGKKYPLTKAEFVIGRNSECELIMKEKTISARHAKISCIQGIYEIEDLDSTNSTFVNGSKVNKKKLRTADSIKFDVFEFTFINLQDVPRTELSSPNQTETIKETVIRSGKRKPEIHQPDSSEKTQPLLDPAKKKQIKTARKGNMFFGLLIGLTIALVLSYGGALLSILFQNRSSHLDILALFKSELSLYPLRYLHTTWLNVGEWNLATAISLLSLVLGPFIGALISQDMGGKRRLTTAIVFSITFVAAVALVQVIILELNLNNWLNTALGSGLGITSRIINFIAVMTYFWIVCYIFSFIGTLAGKKVNR